MVPKHFCVGSTSVLRSVAVQFELFILNIICKTATTVCSIYFPCHMSPVKKLRWWNLNALGARRSGGRILCLSVSMWTGAWLHLENVGTKPLELSSITPLLCASTGATKTFWSQRPQSHVWGWTTWNPRLCLHLRPSKSPRRGTLHNHEWGSRAQISL